MSYARRLEGPRAPLFYSLVFAVCVAAPPLQAQSVDQEDLQRCAEMSTAERRLACFESLMDTSPPPAAVDVMPAETPPVAAAAPAVAETATAEAVSAVAPAAAETVPVAKPVEAAQPGNDFGGEYVKDAEDDDKRQDVTVTVNEVTSDRYKRLHFQFANGQVWRQLEARRFQYPKNKPFDVVISRGVLGDYQLRVGGEGRMTRIKRVK